MYVRHVLNVVYSTYVDFVVYVMYGHVMQWNSISCNAMYFNVCNESNIMYSKVM